MKIDYKKVKVIMPHCGDCGEMLLGNNSHISPFECKCGKWKADYKSPLYYKLIK